MLQRLTSAQVFCSLLPPIEPLFQEHESTSYSARNSSRQIHVQALTYCKRETFLSLLYKLLRLPDLPSVTRLFHKSQPNTSPSIPTRLDEIPALCHDSRARYSPLTLCASVGCILDTIDAVNLACRKAIP